MKVIAVVNQKGGVAKTNVCTNLAIGLANKGRRVILLDADPQGSQTVSLGFAEQDEIPITIATLMGKIIEEEKILYKEGILHHKENVDLIPANIELAAMETTLVNTISRETILRQYLKNIESDYDFLIIDCSPSLGMVTINALASADELIIPVQAQYLSIKGMEQLFKTINKVRKQINTSLKIGGILITMADMRTNYTKDIIELLHESYDGKLRIFNSIIPFSVRASEISAEGISIYKHDPSGKVAEAYENLVLEVLNG